MLALPAAHTAQTPPPASVAEAVIKVADTVCRPAADTQTPPANFAAAAGYTREAAQPANLPVGTSALATWRAPSPQGRLYVMSGLFPESTTPGSCLVALYDATADGPVPALEDTIRYGIRSGHAKARNVTAMPAYGHGGQLGLEPGEIDALVLYVASLSGDTVDPAARRRGHALYAGRANCVECHSADGTGNADWGAPDLTLTDDGAWIYGRDRARLRRTIAGGRAGRCPAWIGTLDAATIHALALWLRSGQAQPAS